MKLLLHKNPAHPGDHLIPFDLRVNDAFFYRWDISYLKSLNKTLDWFSFMCYIKEKCPELFNLVILDKEENKKEL